MSSLIIGCSMFDSVLIESSGREIIEKIEPEPEHLKDHFTEPQILGLQKAFMLSVTSQEKTTTAKARGQPASDFEFEDADVKLAAYKRFDPGQHSGKLYTGAVVLVIGSILLGKFIGWGILVPAFIGAAGLVVLGRMTAMPYAGVTLFVLAGLILLAYVLWRLFIGKKEHKVVSDTADILTPEQKSNLPKADRVEIERNTGPSFWGKLLNKF